MKKIILITCLFCVSFILANITSVKGQNWSGWRGNNRNGTVTGFITPTQWPAQLNKLWQVTVGEADASPVMSNGHIYLHVKLDSMEVAICIDGVKGEQEWKTVLNASPMIKGPAVGHPGPRSTPSISNGKLYLLGAGGIVTCLDLKTGKAIWKNEVYTTEVPQFYTGSSPLVMGGKCFVQLGGKTNGQLIVFDANTGKEVDQVMGISTTYSSPVVMTTIPNMLLVQSEVDLFGVSIDGKLLWDIATPVQRMFNNAATPVFDGQNVVVTGSGSGTKLVSIAKVGEKWETKELWTNKDLGTSFATPIVKGGYLYGNEAKNGKLYCLNMKTGEKCWSDTIAHNRFAALLDLGKQLVTLPATGQLIFFEPSEKSYVEIAKYKVAETEVYAYPIIVGDKIYVKDKTMLTCWSLK
ncbi:MAG: PQQ-binding-like beta-propeller repeat protein [Mariniphaga sp.]